MDHPDLCQSETRNMDRNLPDSQSLDPKLSGAVLTSKYKYLNNINSNCFQLKLSGGNSNRKQMVTHFKHFKLLWFNGEYIIPWKTPRVLERTEQFFLKYYNYWTYESKWNKDSPLLPRSGCACPSPMKECHGPWSPW